MLRTPHHLAYPVILRVVAGPIEPCIAGCRQFPWMLRLRFATHSMTDENRTPVPVAHIKAWPCKESVNALVAAGVAWHPACTCVVACGLIAQLLTIRGLKHDQAGYRSCCQHWHGTGGWHGVCKGPWQLA